MEASVWSVRFQRLPHNSDLPLPARETPGSAGYDVRSAHDDFVLAVGEIKAVPTGLIMEIPAGYECQARPRSGLAFRHGITMPNSPGTIDSDYRGELKVLLQNLGSEPVTIARGERIAQLVFQKVGAPSVLEVTSTGETERGSGGFGSTGAA